MGTESRSFLITGTDITEEEYRLEVNCPSRSDLFKILEPPSERIKTEATFSHGVLASVPHSVSLHIFRSGDSINAGLYIKLAPKSNEIVKVVEPVGISFFSTFGPESPEVGSVYPSSQPVQCQMPDHEYFEYSRWPDHAAHVVFDISVTKRVVPSIQIAKGPVTNLQTQMLPCGHDGYLDTKPFFLSSDLSDMAIECSGACFPVHRIILAGKSEVFAAMFRSPLKESQEGRIVVRDIEPSILKELLRFMYTGSIESDGTTEMMMALYKAADKYDVKDLLLFCENHLLNLMTVDNVMDIYDLTQSRPESALAAKACQTIAWNKESFAGDPESLKNFTCKYPELLFKIFRL